MTEKSTIKIAHICKPMDCPYNKHHRTYMISARTGGSRLSDYLPCSILSEYPTVFYCRVDIDEFNEKCPLKDAE